MNKPNYWTTMWKGAILSLLIYILTVVYVMNQKMGLLIKMLW